MPTVSRQRAVPAAGGNHTPVPTHEPLRSAWDLAEGIKLLLYGMSATGKTTFWATAPKPILALICSGGNKPGELRSINTAEYRKSITPLVVGSTDDFRRILRERKKEYATLVLDHATGLQDLVLKEILGLEQIPAQKTFGLASREQYGQCVLQSKELLRELLGFRGNVVVVAQEREFNADNSSELLTPYVGAGLTPSLTGWVNTACDYICQTYKRSKEEVRVSVIAGKTIEQRVKGKAVEYCLRVGPDPVYQTKFRIPKGAALPDALVDPDWGKLVALIEQKR